MFYEYMQNIFMKSSQLADFLAKEINVMRGGERRMGIEENEGAFFCLHHVSNN